MANKKLTLSMDPEVIEAAKKFAADSNESLSSMVEDFFRNMIRSTALNKKVKKLEFKGHFKKLRGAVKLPKNFDYDEFRAINLRNEYLK